MNIKDDTEYQRVIQKALSDVSDDLVTEDPVVLMVAATLTAGGVVKSKIVGLDSTEHTEAVLRSLATAVQYKRVAALQPPYAGATH